VYHKPPILASVLDGKNSRISNTRRNLFRSLTSWKYKLPDQLTTITDYFHEIDALELINRRTYIPGGERVENSAEHSWHLAMACWSISKSFQLDLSEEKLLKLALMHDLGEIDAGDTFLYSGERNAPHTAERKCVKRLENHGGNAISNLSEL